MKDSRLISPPQSGNIKLLDRDTINHIAAGEVIENPACIVRELLDNAIDSGADRIEVRVDFNDFFIEVLDNGCGIHPDDVALAFKKHSTSKILKFEDIYFTPTLGFRGEALASISSISDVTIETSINPYGEGVRFHIRGNKEDSLEEIACNQGTRIQVKDLFFNTPVRKKFLSLKKLEGDVTHENYEPVALQLKSGERKNIKQEIIRHILGNDGIDFKYFIIGSGPKGGEKLEINVPSHYTLFDKILMFFKSNAYGASLERCLLKIKESLNGFNIEGYITNLSIREFRSDKQFLIIKNRVVQEPAFLKAVSTAYLHKIPRGSHPMIFLRIKLDYNDTVDTNVHPRKEQVKFQSTQLFFDSIRIGIKNTLQKNFNENIKKIHTEKSSYPNPNVSHHSLEKDSLPPHPIENIENIEKLKADFQTHSPFTVSDKERELQRQTLYDSKKLQEQRLFDETSSTSSLLQENLASDLPLKILGQISDTFIVFSIGEDLFIVDQHAAHERINFDRLLTEIQKKEIDTQLLLLPILVEKSVTEKESILLQKKLLSHLGFEIEEFGDHTLRINRVPAYLPENKVEKVVQAILQVLVTRPAETTIEPDSVEFQEFLGNLVAHMACRMSIFGGERLSHTAMESLIEEIYDKEYVFTCPHGRPFVKQISLKEMQQFFDRGRHISGEIDS